MKAKNIFISTGLVLSAVLGVSSTAQAASFKTNFTPNPFNPVTDSKGNIKLQSIEHDGKTFTSAGDNLFFVTDVVIEENKGTSVGGAGADKGDDADAPFPNKDNLALTDGALAAAYLGSDNLNNIIDTEEDGFFKKVLTFSDKANKLFFWERGMNSKLKVEVLAEDGITVIGNAVTIETWEDAGYEIDTKEVVSRQKVGSHALTLADFGLANNALFSKIRLIAESSFNGPDYKVVAGVDISDPIIIPEPTTIIGLGSVAALALLRRRQTKKASV
jgi:hypothetical protein